MDHVHSEKIGRYTVRIVNDDDPEDPREWDGQLGRMLCLHRSYQLGDKHKLDAEEIAALANDPANVALPLFLYDHSGITMSTGDFSAVDPGGWDSGIVGFIIATPETLKACGWEGKTREEIVAGLEQEVKTYDDYLTGNVWGYVVKDEDGHHVESCYGFLGDYDGDGGALSEGRSVARDLNADYWTVGLEQVAQL